MPAPFGEYDSHYKAVAALEATIAMLAHQGELT
jgi:hypothetical protein